ncbi:MULTISPECIES: hypothetical protein [Listeria]|uniref:Uncharacterized protein n=1 Tax=Listeria rustica TaxID=2713503 RepID=A0A7W1T6V1_9LIST|nr:MULTISPECIES: hypothetical protein [Listeria]KMT62692.1 hypothetical protein X559_0975 [Listeria newyorkensis]MBA3926576.1 hypothetical protein [Listeria rustica]
MDINVVDKKVKYLSKLRSQYKEIEEAKTRVGNASIGVLGINCPSEGKPSCERSYVGRFVQDFEIDERLVTIWKDGIVLELENRLLAIENEIEKALGGMPDEQ